MKIASHASNEYQAASLPWLKIALIALVIEKVVQHFIVTLAFYFDWGEIGSTVVVSPRILMILGTIVALLLAASLWGLVRSRAWATKLVMGLALFDIAGEFIAQGKFAIVITVSFVVAMILLGLSFADWRRETSS